MEVDKKIKVLNAKIDRWNFEAEYNSENSIKIFFYYYYPWENKFIGFYNPKDGTIKPLYYNKYMDFRNGWKPTQRQVKLVKKYCNELLKNI